MKLNHWGIRITLYRRNDLSVSLAKRNWRIYMQKRATGEYTYWSIPVAPAPRGRRTRDCPPVSWGSPLRWNCSRAPATRDSAVASYSPSPSDLACYSTRRWSCSSRRWLHLKGQTPFYIFSRRKCLFFLYFRSYQILLKVLSVTFF